MAKNSTCFPFLSFMLLMALIFTGCDSEAEQTSTEQIRLTGSDFSVLVFSKTAGFRHSSIEAGVEAIQLLGIDNDFEVTATEDAVYFTPENLANYEAVIFLNTTETVFDDEQRASFKEYIENGGGFVGVHSATDTEYEWPWFNRLVGAYFDSHPQIQEAVLHVIDSGHPSTEMLPERWEREDEWYNFRDFNEDVHVLITIDTDSYEGSAHPGDHPMAWYHEFDGGRSFYTALGHTEESYTEPLFLEHLLGGIRYAAGVSEVSGDR